MTRRALGKTTWPGVWSNSFCGHPNRPSRCSRPCTAEPSSSSASNSTDIELALPLFRYRATDTIGIVEYEVCPVYIATTYDEPVLNPLEVVDAKWVDAADLALA